jgi:hypothetical protein
MTAGCCGKEQGPEADAEKPEPTPEQKRRAKVAMRAKLQGLEDATGDDNPFNALKPVDILRIIAVTGTRYGSGYPNPKAWEKNAGSNYLDAVGGRPPRTCGARELRRDRGLRSGV